MLLRVAVGNQVTVSRNRDLPAGVYYYSAEVTFNALNPEEANKVISGWVQIIR